MSRRDALALAALTSTTVLHLSCVRGQDSATGVGNRSAETLPNKNAQDTDNGDAMRIHYVEIVTKDVETICTLYSKLHGVTFGDADQNLGGARTARLASGGGMLGVRAPMHDGERPVVRPYILVDDVEATVAAAAKFGADIAVPPMNLPGHGTCAIIVQGGIESGLWQI